MQPERNARPTDTEIIQAIKEFTRGQEEEIANTPTEDLERYLSEHQISIEPSRADIRERLEAARNRLSLSAAREERLRAEEKKRLSVADAVRGAQLTGQQLLNEVRRRLGTLDPDVALAFRNYEQSDDDDLRTILEKLDQLESEE